jgi:predicted nucleic acid-binding protein
MTLVDSSVLIDFLEGQAPWADWSERQIVEARRRGRVLINLIVYSEISRDFPEKAELDAFLRDVGIAVEPFGTEVAFAAARAHDRYRDAGGQRTATLPDFFIGAHASVSAIPLLTRDPKRIRQYFPDVELIAPE